MLWSLAPRIELHEKLLLFLNFILLRKCLHDNCKEQIQQEKGPNNDKDREKESSNHTVSIQVVVHNSGPALKCDHAKYLQC